MVGVPGAFTPTCSGTHVPGYLAKQADLKAKGVEEVIVCSVNDGAVMEGWAKDQNLSFARGIFSDYAALKDRREPYNGPQSLKPSHVSPSTPVVDPGVCVGALLS